MTLDVLIALCRSKGQHIMIDLDMNSKCLLIGMTRPIKDEHSMEDDVTPVMNPGNARVIGEHKITIQYLQ